jgi:uncharacterized protein YciI
MNKKETPMHIIFLRFGAQRAQARQWMQAHKQWIEQGIGDGIFLLAGSLDDGQGGVLLAAAEDRQQLQARLEQDPFAQHQVVSAEIVAVKPSRPAPALQAALAGA